MFRTLSKHQEKMKRSSSFGEDQSSLNISNQNSVVFPYTHTHANCFGRHETFVRKKMREKPDLLCRPAKGWSEIFEVVLTPHLGHEAQQDGMVCNMNKCQCQVKVSNIKTRKKKDQLPVKTTKKSKKGRPPNVSNNSTNASPIRGRQGSVLVPYKGRVVCVEGDGRCLFRAIVVCVAPLLQKAKRNQDGIPVRQKYSKAETQWADNLRALMITHMHKDMDSYKNLDVHVLNADQGRKAFSSIQDRLTSMSNTRACAGEIEINALTTVLKRPILVLDSNLHYINTYGAENNLNKSACALRFTRVSSDVGHYDAVILAQDLKGCDLCRKPDASADFSSKARSPSRSTSFTSSISTDTDKTRKKSGSQIKRIARKGSSRRFSTTSPKRSSQQSSQRSSQRSTQCQCRRKRKLSPIRKRSICSSSISNAVSSTEEINKSSAQHVECVLCRNMLSPGSDLPECYWCKAKSHTACAVKHWSYWKDEFGNMYINCKDCID